MKKKEHWYDLAKTLPELGTSIFANKKVGWML
jgi:hypothetical protein